MTNQSDTLLETLDERLVMLEDQLEQRQELITTLDELVNQQRQLEPIYYGAVAAIQRLEQLILDEERRKRKSGDKSPPHNYHADLYQAQQAHDEIRPQFEALEAKIIKLRAKIAALAGVKAEYESVQRQKAALIEAAKQAAIVAKINSELPDVDEANRKSQLLEEKRLAIIERQDWFAIQILMLETELRTLQFMSEEIHSQRIEDRMIAIEKELREFLESEEKARYERQSKKTATGSTSAHRIPISECKMEF